MWMLPWVATGMLAGIAVTSSRLGCEYCVLATLGAEPTAGGKVKEAAE